jgi:plastocyanin
MDLLVPPREGGPDASPAATQAPPHPAELPHRPVVDRVVLPLALPLLCAAAVLLYVLDLSRALLAGGHWGSLVVASIVTVAILGGATWISARPRVRTSTLVMAVAGLLVLVAAGGLTAIGPSQEKSGPATPSYHEPAGAAGDTLTVQANGASFSFQSKTFTVKAGIVRINYVNGQGGSHTLLFDDPRFNGFELSVPGGPASKKVDLPSGRYTIYCSVGNHRQLGMQATIIAQ